MSVVIISDLEDLHADCVVSKLQRRGAEVIRLSPIDDFGKEFFLSSAPGHGDSLILGGTKIQLSEVSGVYCRTAVERLPESFAARNYLEKYCIEEESSAWLTALLLIPSQLWINDPRHEIWSDVKSYSLLVAQKIGIRVPPFIISNLLSRSEQFAATGRLVIKPISEASLAHQDGMFLDVPSFTSFDSVGTSLFCLEKFGPDEVDGTPFLLQRYIRRHEEYRITIADDRIISAKADIESSIIDIKDSIEHKYALCQLSHDLEELLHRLMNALGLRVCTFDMVRAENGDVFLVDINPSGNWLWLDLQFDGLISEKIASGLLHRPSHTS